MSGLIRCCFVFLFAHASISAEAWKFSENINDGEVYENITLAGAVKLVSGKDKNSAAREISGIAWDNDEQILYGVSDDGYIVHMKLNISQDNILNDVDILQRYWLKDKSGNNRDEADADAEGLTLDNASNNIKGDTVLNIVLDKPARAEQFTNTGEYIGLLQLPDKLNKLSSDQAFEINAVAGNANTGYMYLTKKRMTYKNHLMFVGPDREYEIALDNNASINIVGADLIENDGLYFLDRNYKAIWLPVIYCIRKFIEGGHISNIACFNSKEGWNLDNFETITHYKDKYFLIMSDDEESAFQKTLIVMFKINN